MVAASAHSHTQFDFFEAAGRELEAVNSNCRTAAAVCSPSEDCQVVLLWRMGYENSQAGPSYCWVDTLSHPIVVVVSHAHARSDSPDSSLEREQKPHTVGPEHSRPGGMVRQAVCSTMHSLHTAAHAVEGVCMVEDHWAAECVARDYSVHLAFVYQP
jgi:hypothetical protein